MLKKYTQKDSQRIGILTLNQQLNYGGVLQSYALQRYLQNQGFNAEVLTYWLAENNQYLYGPHLLNDSLPLFIRILKYLKYEYRKGFVFSEIYRRWRTIQFIHRYIHMSEKRYRSADELTEIKGYDSIIVGSDQVWNTWYGRNNPFLLQRIQSGINKLAYAPSFGVKEVSSELLNEYSHALNQFSFLSCREKQGVDIIRELTGREATWVVDPTLLLNQEEWNRQFSIHPSSGDYIFCYWLGSFPDIIPALQKIAQQKKKNIHLFLQDNISNSTWGDKAFREHWKKEFSKSNRIKLVRSAGPIEFVTKLASASSVISNSFHALMFAIIYQKPVRIVIDTVPERIAMSDRMYDFCRRIDAEKIVTDSLLLTESACAPTLKYNKEKLAKWIQDSQDFLLEMLQ